MIDGEDVRIRARPCSFSPACRAALFALRFRNHLFAVSKAVIHAATASTTAIVLSSTGIVRADPNTKLQVSGPVDKIHLEVVRGWCVK